MGVDYGEKSMKQTMHKDQAERSDRRLDGRASEPNMQEHGRARLPLGICIPLVAALSLAAWAVVVLLLRVLL